MASYSSCFRDGMNRVLAPFSRWSLQEPCGFETSLFMVLYMKLTNRLDGLLVLVLYVSPPIPFSYREFLHAQHIINPVLVTPPHKLVPAEPRVPSYDASVFPLTSNPGDNPLQFFLRSRRGILVGFAEPAQANERSQNMRERVRQVFGIGFGSQNEETQGLWRRYSGPSPRAMRFSQGRASHDIEGSGFEDKQVHDIDIMQFDSEM